MFNAEKIADQLAANEDAAERAAGGYRLNSAYLLAAELPPGEVDTPQVREAIELVSEALDERGVGITTGQLRGWFLAAKRNPRELINGASITALMECGEHPDRFKWYAEYGSKLSKRQVRRLRGDRRVDNVVPTTDAEREQKAGDLLGQMSDEALEEFAIRNPRVAAAVTRGATRAGHGARSQANEDAGIPAPKVGDDFGDYLHTMNLGVKRRLQAVITRQALPVGVRGGVMVELPKLQETLAWLQSWADGEGTALVDQISTFLQDSEELS